MSSRPTAALALAMISALATSCSVASAFGAPVACDVDDACPTASACIDDFCASPPTRGVIDDGPPVDVPPCETVFREALVDGVDGVEVFLENASSTPADDAVDVELPPSESIFFATIAGGAEASTIRYEVPILDGEPAGSGQQFYIGTRIGDRIYELLLFDDGLAVARMKEPDQEPRDLIKTIPELDDAPHPIRLRIEASDDAGAVVRMSVLTRDDVEVFAAAFPAPSSAAEEFFFAAQNFAPVDDVTRLRVGQVEVSACAGDQP